MIIGSTALKHWCPDLPRVPADLDIWAPPSRPNTRALEYRWDPLFGEIIQEYCDPEYAPLNLLLTIKMSHAPWSDVWFDKTTFDIGFMQSRGAVVDEPVYSRLYTHWETQFGKKRAYLAKDNDSFFDDGVKRIYVHDDLHRAIAFYDSPLFERLKPDLSKAACSKTLFFALSREDQVRCIQEEAFVVALERFLIPCDFTMSAYAAYRQALKLLATKMTKGWFSREIFNRWLDLSPKPAHDFVKRFKTALNSNSINYATHIQPTQ